MANSGASYCTRHAPRCSVRDREFRIVPAEAHTTSDALEELDESDVIWQVAAATTRAKGTTRMWSTPVNIPEWSQIICRQQQIQEEREPSEEEYGCSYNKKDGFTRTPPHEFMAKRMANVMSFSVHEGVGRTLKGRDLSTLRNAIWEKTGFLD